MTERSRSRHNERSSRIKTSRNQYSPEGSRDIVCIEKVDYSSESEYSSDSEFQHPPTRNVSCQTRTKFVIQSKPKQKKPLRKEHPIGYVTREESEDRDYSQKYVIQFPSTRNVRCQMTTQYLIPAQHKKRKYLHKKTQVGLLPDTTSPRPLTPLSDNIEVTIYYDKDFKSLYPKSRKNSYQCDHYIDLRKPTDTLDQKPIEVFGRDNIYQLKKDGYTYDKVRDAKNSSVENFVVMVQKERHIYDKVTDNVELISMNSSMEGDGDVERFFKDRQQLKNSNVSEEQKKNFINQTIVYDYR